MASKLTVKQDKFCNKYLECGNASEAYRFAYNCENMKAEVIHNKASELLKKGEIKVRVENMRADFQKTSDITKEDILVELASIGFANISKDIRPKDKTSALAEINKMLGHYAPVKTAQTDSQGNDIAQPLTPERKKEILKEVGL